MGSGSSRKRIELHCDAPPPPPPRAPLSPRICPDRTVINNKGECVRLNVPYYQSKYSLMPLRIFEEDALCCPKELVAAELMHKNLCGASRETPYLSGEMQHTSDVTQVWDEFMGPGGALERLEQQYPQCIPLAWCLLVLSMLPGMCWILHFLNRLQQRRCKALHAEMVAFQNAMNDKLQHCGIMMTPRSNAITVQGGDGLERTFVHWFSFALTPEEVAKLRRETSDTLRGGVEHSCTFNLKKHNVWAF